MRVGRDAVRAKTSAPRRCSGQECGSRDLHLGGALNQSALAELRRCNDAYAKPSEELLVLRRKPRITGWLSLGWRLVAMVALLGILILIHWLEREGLKDTA